MRILFTGYLIMVVLCSEAQLFHNSISASAYAIANAAVAEQDQWTIFNNVGGISNTRDLTALFSIYRRFNINELSTLHIALVYPKGASAVGVTLQRFGDHLFSQNQLGIALGHNLGKTSLGIKANYLRTNTSFFGHKNSIVIELGGMTDLTPSITIGFYVYNINLAKTGTSDTSIIPLIVKTGFSYQPNLNFTFNFQLEKSHQTDITARIGLQYKMKEKLKVATGLQTNPLRNHFGISFELSKLVISYGFSHHHPLGFSQILSLSLKIDA